MTNAEDPETALRKAESLEAVGRDETAMSVVQQVLARDPQNAQALYFAGRLHYGAEEWAPAVSAFRACLALDADNTAAMGMLAMALAEQGDRAEAVRLADRAAQLAPESWFIHSLRAQVMRAVGRKQQALAAALEAVRLSPETANTHITLAAMAMDARDLRLAEQAAREALRLEPENAGVQHVLGALELERGDIRTGTADVAASLALNPRAQVARKHLTYLAFHVPRFGTTWAIAALLLVALAKAVIHSPFSGVPIAAVCTVVIVVRVTRLWLDLRAGTGGGQGYVSHLLRTDRMLAASLALFVLAVALLLASATASSWTGPASLALVLLILRIALNRVQRARNPDL